MYDERLDEFERVCYSGVLSTALEEAVVAGMSY
jgi:hypothetical protein